MLRTWYNMLEVYIHASIIVIISTYLYTFSLYDELVFEPSLNIQFKKLIIR